MSQDHEEEERVDALFGGDELSANSEDSLSIGSNQMSDEHAPTEQIHPNGKGEDQAVLSEEGNQTPEGAQGDEGVLAKQQEEEDGTEAVDAAITTTTTEDEEVGLGGIDDTPTATTEEEMVEVVGNDATDAPTATTTTTTTTTEEAQSTDVGEVGVEELGPSPDASKEQSTVSTMSRPTSAKEATDVGQVVAGELGPSPDASVENTVSTPRPPSAKEASRPTSARPVSRPTSAKPRSRPGSASQPIFDAESQVVDSELKPISDTADAQGMTPEEVKVAATVAPPPRLPSAMKGGNSRPTSALKRKGSGSRVGSPNQVADSGVQATLLEGAPLEEGQSLTSGSRPLSAEKDEGAGESEDQDRSAKLTFVIAPEGYTHEGVFSTRETVASVKMTLEKQLKINFNNIKLSFRGQILDNKRPLSAYNIPSTSTSTSGSAPPVSIDLQIVYLEKPQPKVLPSLMTVTVDSGPGVPLKQIQVTIVQEKRPKVFMGGYRDRRSGTEYNHAAQQTDKPALTEEQREHQAIPRFHREAQTVNTRTCSTITTREYGTQMSKSGLVVDGDDTILYPRPYFDLQQWEALRLAKTVKIQCHVRGWFARIHAAEVRKQVAERRRIMAEQEAERARVESERRRTEIERRMHPRTAEDFEILYKELEAWRLQETNKINDSGLPETERLAALAQLLHKETKLLQTIDRLKSSAAVENKAIRIKNTLSAMAAPKKWGTSDGKIMEVHTPFTTRARELQELYNGLRLPLLTIDERLDVLLHVKWSVKEFDCSLTREIVDLIDREADILNRGRSEKSLEGLRRRISNLFLQFCETPEFNPEAIRFQKVPRELFIQPNVRPI